MNWTQIGLAVLQIVYIIYRGKGVLGHVHTHILRVALNSVGEDGKKDEGNKGNVGSKNAIARKSEHFKQCCVVKKKLKTLWKAFIMILCAKSRADNAAKIKSNIF